MACREIRVVHFESYHPNSRTPVVQVFRGIQPPLEAMQPRQVVDQGGGRRVFGAEFLFAKPDGFLGKWDRVVVATLLEQLRDLPMRGPELQRLSKSGCRDQRQHGEKQRHAALWHGTFRPA